MPRRSNPRILTAIGIGATASLAVESISQLFDRTAQRSQLPRIRFHDLRHTHASLLVADGTAIKVVTERRATTTPHSRCTPTNTSCQV